MLLQYILQFIDDQTCVVNSSYLLSFAKIKEVVQQKKKQFLFYYSIKIDAMVYPCDAGTVWLESQDT